MVFFQSQFKKDWNHTFCFRWMLVGGLRRIWYEVADVLDKYQLRLCDGDSDVGKTEVTSNHAGS